MSQKAVYSFALILISQVFTYFCFFFTAGIVYNLLYEDVFRDRVSFSCGQRLSRLQESEMSKLDEPTPEDRALVNLKKQFPTDVLVGMAPNLFRNVALDVHKREKEGEWK